MDEYLVTWRIELSAKTGQTKPRPVEPGSTAFEWRQACREYHAKRKGAK